MPGQSPTTINTPKLYSNLKAILAAEDDAIPKYDRFIDTLRSGGGQLTSQEFEAYLERNRKEDDFSKAISAETIRSWGIKGKSRPIITEQHLSTILTRIFNSTVRQPDLSALMAQAHTLRLSAWAREGKTIVSWFSPAPTNNKVADDSTGVDSTRIYSYWVVERENGENELDPFVLLSDGEPEIREQNPELFGHARRLLYLDWLSLIPRGFMMLRKYDPESGTSDVVAVSILIPLSQGGADAIRDRTFKATELKSEHVALDTPAAILLDTWIVKPKNGSGIDYDKRRIDHEGYAALMLPLHIGLFWNCERELTVFVEPDNDKIKRVCAQLGFFPKLDKKKGDCYSLTISGGIKSNVYTKRALAQAVMDLKSFPIRRIRQASK